MTAPSQYSLDEWREDYAFYSALTKSTLGQSAASFGTELLSRFKSSRKNANDADYCFKRFTAAVMYLESNIKAIEFGKVAVSGTDRFMISSHAIDTLYRFFAGASDSQIKRGPPIDQFVQEVKNAHDPES